VSEPLQRLDVFLGNFAVGAFSVDPRVAVDAALEPLALEVDLSKLAMALVARVRHLVVLSSWCQLLPALTPFPAPRRAGRSPTARRAVGLLGSCS